MDFSLAVKPLSVGLFCPTDGIVESFKPRSYIPDRKSIKLMTRPVQLGVAAASVALNGSKIWQDVAPERRGFFVGARPLVGDQNDIQDALLASFEGEEFSLSAYAEKGISRIHPLWLVRGLSNNILGFGSAFWNFQGINMNYCQGDQGGWNALVQGALAVHEKRADVVLSGGADSLVGAESIIGSDCSEGGAFILWGRSDTPFKLVKSDLEKWATGLGKLGAAKWPIALARKLLANNPHLTDEKGY